MVRVNLDADIPFVADDSIKEGTSLFTRLDDDRYELRLVDAPERLGGSLKPSQADIVTTRGGTMGRTGSSAGFNAGDLPNHLPNHLPHSADQQPAHVTSRHESDLTGSEGHA